MLSIKKQQRKSKRNGATAVEVAIVLPLFLSLIFACMEFSRISLIRSQSSNAAYEAARSAMVLGGDAVGAQNAAMRVLGPLGVNTVDIVPSFLDDAGLDVPPLIATRVRVRVDVPYGPNSFFGSFLPSTPSNDTESISLANALISSQVTLRTNNR